MHLLTERTLPIHKISRQWLDWQIYLCFRGLGEVDKDAFQEVKGNFVEILNCPAHIDRIQLTIAKVFMPLENMPKISNPWTVFGTEWHKSNQKPSVPPQKITITTSQRMPRHFFSLGKTADDHEHERRTRSCQHIFSNGKPKYRRIRVSTALQKRTKLLMTLQNAYDCTVTLNLQALSQHSF